LLKILRGEEEEEVEGGELQEEEVGDMSNRYISKIRFG
jgi:hypothetical protein